MSKTDKLVAERARLLIDLHEICVMKNVVVDDAMIVRLLDLCQRSLTMLELPQKAAMQVVIAAMEEAGNIVEREGDYTKDKAYIDAGRSLKEVAVFLEDRENAHA